MEDQKIIAAFACLIWILFLASKIANAFCSRKTKPIEGLFLLFLIDCVLLGVYIMKTMSVSLGIPVFVFSSIAILAVTQHILND